MLRIELSYRVPERFVSLTLCVTTAGGFQALFNIPPVRQIQVLSFNYADSQCKQWVGFKNLLRYDATY